MKHIHQHVRIDVVVLGLHAKIQATDGYLHLTGDDTGAHFSLCLLKIRDTPRQYTVVMNEIFVTMFAVLVGLTELSYLFVVMLRCW